MGGREDWGSFGKSWEVGKLWEGMGSFGKTREDLGRLEEKFTSYTF